MEFLSDSVKSIRSSGPIKHIYVWENGDFNGNGHVLAINPKYYRKWNSILGLITGTLRPTFGIVRCLVHLNGRGIIHSFDSSKPNEKYVSLGFEKLKLAKNKCGKFVWKSPRGAVSNDVSVIRLLK
ncbi:hypothetical protein ABEB36_001644 [Hypothenemus hampei]|uniref:Doublecortin domain-containing protein n=1 Tax=Hypothenemus hampei TaxID=57062 RepID=A0ABD1FF88_HYPHA